MAETIFNRPATTTFVLRGYNVTNLGRTFELLNHPRYGRFLDARLRQGSEIASEVVRRSIDLIGRVRRQQETELSSYADAIALIVAAEIAQIDILEQEFGVDLAKFQYLMGYSLGELAALVAAKTLSLEDALTVPLALANDVAKLADRSTLAVVFSRRARLADSLVHKICQEVSAEGKGLIGISAILSPNSVIVIGEGETTSRLQQRLSQLIPERVYMKKNPHRWPPMHTPIVWREHINSRAALLMSTMQSGFTAPTPPVLSLVTGDCGYTDSNVRDIIGQWVDRPQHLWQAVYATLAAGTETVVHVGPEPNIVPATYSRLAENVATQVRASISTQALSTLVHRPWLKNLIPKRAYLLRAPSIRQIILEDWLLENSG